MHPADILRVLEADGLRLSASGDSVIVQPKKRLTDGARAIIRDNKAALLLALRVTTTRNVAATPGLADMVGRVGRASGFTPAEVDEALTHALAKPDEARECFEGLAAEAEIPRADPWDDRIVCKQCANRRYDGVCLAAVRQEFPAARGYTPDPEMRRRCEGFAPRPGDPDRRNGSKRWPGLNPESRGEQS